MHQHQQNDPRDDQASRDDARLQSMPGQEGADGGQAAQTLNVDEAIGEHTSETLKDRHARRQHGPAANTVTLVTELGA